jgi:hypothetical protein
MLKPESSQQSSSGCTHIHQTSRKSLNSPDLAPRDYQLFTYLKNSLRSQRFSSNGRLMKGVKTWLRSQTTDFLTQAYKNVFLNMTSAAIPAVTTLRSSLSMYVFLYIIKFSFSLHVLLTAHLNLLSEHPSCYTDYFSPFSPVGVATDYGLDGRGRRRLSPGKGKNLHLYTSSRRILEPTQHPI